MLGKLELQAIRSLVTSPKAKVKTDNLVFRLHYKVTSLLFLAASGILITEQFFGQSIDCYTDGSDKMEEGYKKTIDNICWVTSTFVLKDQLCGRIGKEVTYPGIGTLTPKNTPFDIHVTYRFLFFVMFLQGISFLMPHYLWKSWESEKMQMLSDELEKPLLDNHTKSNKIISLTNYLLHGQTNGSIKYSFHLHFCEMMNLIIVGMNVWITDYLFRNEFIGYGINKLLRASDFYNPACDDPIKYLFPPIAKCVFNSFGPSGSIQNRDVVCVLPLNDFNSFFFKFIWVWFAFLLVTSMIWLLFRVVTFYSCILRSWLLTRRAGLLPITPSHSHESGTCCSKICKRIGYADWMLVMQLGCNMDPLTYKIFLEAFCQQTATKAGDYNKAHENNTHKQYYSHSPRSLSLV